MIRTNLGKTNAEGNTIELAADIFVLIGVFNKMFEDEDTGDLIADMIMLDKMGQDEVGKVVTHLDEALKRVNKEVK